MFSPLFKLYFLDFCRLPTRRKRQLEEHGGPHNYEPSEEDATFILPLFMPDRLPAYDGNVAADLIEVVQKKFLSVLTPTSEETEKVSFCLRFDSGLCVTIGSECFIFQIFINILR